MKKVINFKRFVSLTLIAGLLVTGLNAYFLPKSTLAATTPSKFAVIYGDSLTWESAWEMDNVFAGKTAWGSYVHSFPATAPCDWLGWLQGDLATYHPSVVTLTTAGNVSTNCMLDANGVPLVMGSDAYFAQYRQNLNDIFAQVTATGAKMVYMQSPPFKDPIRNAAVIQINSIAAQLAASYHGVSISAAARAALAKNNKYTDYKPCLPAEKTTPDCVNGQIAIRTITGIQAGLHLCPQGLPDAFPWFCTTYSSGEMRYGRAIATATITPPKPILP